MKCSPQEIATSCECVQLPEWAHPLNLQSAISTSCPVHIRLSIQIDPNPDLNFDIGITTGLL